MRIAQIAPLTEPVPPEMYGGTERVVSLLTEVLVSRGHEVTLFASGDSRTGARLVPVIAEALRLGSEEVDPHLYLMLELGMVFDEAEAFDVIHSHVDYFAFPFARLVRTPVVTTLHGRLDLPGLAAIFGRYSEAEVVSISDSQRQPLPGSNWAATVYNGTDLARFTFNETGGEYFAFVGRICPEKNIEGAIRIARLTGVPLRIGAKVDPADVDYHESVIRPLIDGRDVEYLGELGDEEKNELLGSAHALLFPVDWPEPFGLAMTEAMACGTPVLALRRGSVPEVVEDGVTGFVRDSEEELAEVAGAVSRLSRRACRERVERLFSVDVMADGYEAVYRALSR
ncbi:glycosyltransferase family 4 protein [Humibacillus xanthopallidus]|uniref:D-inositol 3-phosphate glycosyltransferase n=1 Tax=Humibacillus xanthopallidus TaxID=412689 RepID=A0A543I0Y9_9MICO|nr:glycosyltransferase family 4 protein [Humibacillus xanthopallidus]TQM64211.1 glycosyltransferase involved in cell wall biosynthesis [Humibacillus xanthopallidus]